MVRPRHLQDEEVRELLPLLAEVLRQDRLLLEDEVSLPLQVEGEHLQLEEDRHREELLLGEERQEPSRPKETRW